MPRPRRRQVRSRRESTGVAWVRWLAALLLVGGLGGGAYWWWRQRSVAVPIVPPARATGPSGVADPSQRSVPPVPATLPPVRPPPPEPASPTLPLPVTPAPVTNLTNGPTAAPGTNFPGTNRTPVQISTNIVRTPPPASPPTPPSESVDTDSPRVNNWLTAQLALVARGISPGSIDGVGGAQSSEALRAFQMDHRLETTGRLDLETIAQLTLNGPVYGEFLVTPQHVARLQPLPSTWLGKSEVPALEFESLAELVGEATQCHPGYLRRLNPDVDWDHPRPGLRLKVLNARFPTPRRAAVIRISLAGKWLRAFDEMGRLLAHFPCSIAARVEKRPVGSLAIAVAVKDPNYTFDPEIFPESPEARSIGRKLVIPPGPNNPVGVAWIGLDRPGYGIHGTPAPEQVGRTESHGCFRLANWNAEYLRQMCWVGLRVQVER